MLITILGYMGSGKSHISKVLARKTGFQLKDLDKEIVRRSGRSIPEIFREKGEIRFRKLERETLADVLTSTHNTIISLGGGTPVYYDNMELINASSVSIYLQANVPVLVERLKRQKQRRPLIANIPDEDLPSFVGQHLFERRAFYEKAKYILPVGDKNAEEIADEITRLPDLLLG